MRAMKLATVLFLALALTAEWNGRGLSGGGAAAADLQGIDRIFDSAGQPLALAITPAAVQTTDATVTTLHSAAIAAESAVTLAVTVQGREAAGGAVFSQTLFAVARNEAGTSSISTVTKQPATAASIGTVTGWVATLDVDDTTDVRRVRVTGAGATTIDWTAVITATTQSD